MPPISNSSGLELTFRLITRPGKPHYVEVWADRESDWSHAPDEDIIMEITNWVATTVQGRRTAYNGWQMHSAQDVTAFMLKWG